MDSETGSILPNNDLIFEALINSLSGNQTITITLNVKGLVVSGLAISSKRYFEKTAELFYKIAKDSSSENDAMGFKQMFLDIADKYCDCEPDKSDKIKGFVHMEDASIWHGKEPIKVGLWRGRLSEVDGFSIGKIDFE